MKNPQRTLMWLRPDPGAFLLAIALLLACGQLWATDIISKNSTWKYMVTSSEPSSWENTGYNDSSWPSGAGEIGYGDGGEATTIGYGGNASNKYITTYFRHSFTVSNPAQWADLTLELQRDDGAVVYLNGTEVYRTNMPGGSISWNTTANSAVSGTDESTYFTQNISNTLVSGTNVLAVEVHQSSATSSDKSFDLALIGNQATNDPDFISREAIWKYWDQGSGISSSWKNTSFNDGSWSSGNAQLGYGDSDEATVISYGPSSTNKYITSYFRYTFSVLDASAFSDVDLELLRDDGAVVYLNGTEVWRSNMPSGSISFSTNASSAVSGGDEDTYYTTTIPNTLQNGTNVIAVEVHQSSSTSSDKSFDFSATGNLIGAIPPYIEFGDTWNYLDDGSNQGTAWQATGFNDAGWSSGPAELGYGDSDENTEVGYGGDANNKYVTTYFRKAFNVASVNPAEYVEMRLKRDDGAVVYLNGTEVWRDGLAGGTVNYTTLANQTIGGGDESSPITQLIPSGMLNVGNNVIAVEIHQVNVTSSDITMDFEMENVGVPTITLERGPYIQMLTQTSAMVKWRTNIPVASKVNYGNSPGSLTDSVYSATSETEHEITINGLTAGTTYFYDFGSSDTVFAGGTSDYFFKTVPASDHTGFTRTWVLGDCGTADNNQRNVRDAYYNYVGSGQTDQILLLGDNAYNDGTDEQYQNAIFENMYEDIIRNTVMWSCPGNHDIYSANSSTQTGPYYDIFSFPKAAEAGGLASGTEAYFSWDYGQIHFISMDSDDTPRDIGSAMLNWLTNDLAATTKPWIVVIFHHPPYTKGSHDSDNAGDSGGRMRDMRENVLPILETYGVDLVLSGHSHSYERSFFLNGHYDVSSTFNNSMKVLDGGGQLDVDCSYRKTSSDGDGAVYVTAGSSGKITGTLTAHNAMYAYLYQRGSVIIETEGNRMDVKFLNESDAVSDYFTIDKNILNGSVDTTITEGSSIDLTASWMYDFTWSPGGATTKTISVSPTTSTQYIVTNGCVSDTFNVTVVPSCTPHQIEVDLGWNIISSYVIPDQPNMLDVVQGHETNIVVIKNGSGQTTFPSIPLNQIGNWSVTEGYKLKAISPFTLEIGCTQVNPSSTPISLTSGWNQIAFLRDNQMDAATALASINSDIILVKDGFGAIYLPSFGLNQIGDMIPGQGYIMKMSQANTLTYPTNSRISNQSTYTPARMPQHFEKPLNTGNNATIVFPEDVVKGLSPGDEIAVINSRGKVSGVGVYNSDACAFTIWGEDGAGDEAEHALTSREPYTFRIWRAGLQKEYTADVTYTEGPGYYSTDGISIAGRITSDAFNDPEQGLTDAVQLSVYPNPSKGQFHMTINDTELDLKGAVLSVVDLIGKEVARQPVKTAEQLIDLSSLPPGSYMIRIMSEQYSLEHQLIIAR